jgi:hypothetical protein
LAEWISRLVVPVDRLVSDAEFQVLVVEHSGDDGGRSDKRERDMHQRSPGEGWEAWRGSASPHSWVARWRDDGRRCGFPEQIGGCERGQSWISCYPNRAGGQAGSVMPING